MLFERMYSEWRWENQLATSWSISDLYVAKSYRVVAEGVRRGRMDEPPNKELADLLRELGVLCDSVLLRAAAGVCHGFCVTDFLMAWALCLRT